MSAQPGYPTLGPAINSDGQYVQPSSSSQDPSTTGNTTYTTSSNVSSSEPYHLGGSQTSNVQGPNEMSNALLQGASTSMRMDSQSGQQQGQGQSQGQQDKLDQQVLVGQVLADDIRKGATVHVSRHPPSYISQPQSDLVRSPFEIKADPLMIPRPDL
jgi:hypothetical protein